MARFEVPTISTTARALIGKRVQIPAYTDRWMMGDRYGSIVGFARGRSDVARVKLDVSGQIRKFLLDDCTVY